MSKFSSIFSWQKSAPVSTIPQPHGPGSTIEFPVQNAFDEEPVHALYQRSRKTALEDMFGAAGR